MNIQIIIIGSGALLLFVIVVVMYLGPSAEKTLERRMTSIKMRHSDSAETRLENQMRKAIASRRPTRIAGVKSGSMGDRMAIRLSQTGKRWSVRGYLYANVAIFCFFTLILLGAGAPTSLCLLVGVLLGLGVPHKWISMLIKRRLGKFNKFFPDAIDLLVRGLRSGLPVGETLGVVAHEIPGPVGEEFKLVTERIKIGRTMEDALQETADRMGTAEFQFFCITLAIQRETGGNLAETLNNLGDVLRKRAQMKLKIKAMSSESKASAYIVGALPFIVIILIYWANSEYILKFTTDERLMIAGAGGFTWMAIGVWIMSKMISFEI